MSHDRGEDVLRRDEAHAVRTVGLLLGSVGVVAVLAWHGMDRLMEPAHASDFLVARVLAVASMLLALHLLRSSHVGRSRPEWPMLLLLASPQVAVGWMVPRTTEATEAYLLGFSLVIYASGLLVPWPPRFTVAVLGITWTSLGVGVVAAPAPVPPADMITSLLYVGTASLLAVMAQLHRHGLAVRERATRVALLHEQQRTAELMAQLERLSYQDALTGLANRRRWDLELALACAEPPAEEVVAVLLCDLDRFKDVNDRLGHAAGDAALKQVAALLLQETRGVDLVARIGGDELAILLRVADFAGAVAVAQRVHAATRALPRVGEGGVRVTLSVGVALVAAGEQPGAVLARADAQLYRAKLTRDAVWAQDTCWGSGASSVEVPEPRGLALVDQPKAR